MAIIELTNGNAFIVTISSKVDIIWHGNTVWEGAPGIGYLLQHHAGVDTCVEIY